MRLRKGRDYNELIDCACGCGNKLLRWDNECREHKYINRHYWRGKKRPQETREKLRKYMTGRPRPSTRGSNHYNYKGGTMINSKGYRLIRKPDHFAKVLCNGYVFEHKYNYEVYYNCCLLPWIDLHHINEERLDNRVENLKPLTKREHNLLHENYLHLLNRNSFGR